MKIVTVIGARPQFVKAATVSRALAGHNHVVEVTIHTGQHYDDIMSEIFFRELDIRAPDKNLQIHGGTHGDMTGRMLTAIENVLSEIRPDIVLIYGDTNSTLAGALAAAKLNIPIAHVEAGLRSFNRRMPEEINRIVADHVSDMLFTPTDTATANLHREGIESQRIYQVGDVMFDAAIFYSSRAEQRSTILSDLGLQPGDYVLATIHRQENTDDPERLRAIVDGLNEVADEVPVVLPLHPRTRHLLDFNGHLPMRTTVKVIQPVGYLDMVMLERGAGIIATDSGGVQKEAYFHKVPCVTLRDETEWVELIDLGWNRLAAPGSADIAATIRDAFGMTGAPGNPYGDGHAAERIVESLLKIQAF